MQQVMDQVPIQPVGYMANTHMNRQLVTRHISGHKMSSSSTSSSKSQASRPKVVSNSSKTGPSRSQRSSQKARNSSKLAEARHARAQTHTPGQAVPPAKSHSRAATQSKDSTHPKLRPAHSDAQAPVQSKHNKNGSHRSSRSTRKKRNSAKKDLLLDNPISIFPYYWTPESDEKYKQNQQFHKREKPLPATMTKPEAVDHLLSPTRCSKRYMSAYFLNLHQLTSTALLLDKIVGKCNPIIKQLQILERHLNKHKHRSHRSHANHRSSNGSIKHSNKSHDNNGNMSSTSPPSVAADPPRNNRRRGSEEMLCDTLNEPNHVASGKHASTSPKPLLPQSTTSHSHTPTQSPSASGRRSRDSQTHPIPSTNSPHSAQQVKQILEQHIETNPAQAHKNTSNNSNSSNSPNSRNSSNSPKISANTDDVESGHKSQRSDSLGSNNSQASLHLAVTGPSTPHNTSVATSTGSGAASGAQNEQTISKSFEMRPEDANNVILGASEDYRVEARSLPDYAMDEMWQSDTAHVNASSLGSVKEFMPRSQAYSIESVSMSMSLRSMSMSSFSMGPQGQALAATALAGVNENESASMHNDDESPDALVRQNSNASDVRACLAQLKDETESDVNGKNAGKKKNYGTDAKNVKIDESAQNKEKKLETESKEENGNEAEWNGKNPNSKDVDTHGGRHKKKRSTTELALKRDYGNAILKHNIELLYHWIDYYPSDFAEASLLEKVVEFANAAKDKIESKSVERRLSKLLQLISHRKSQMKVSSVYDSSISNLRISPKVRKHDRKTSFQFTDSFFPPREMVAQLGGPTNLLTDLHPIVVAEQLTLIDTEIYLQIKLRELTNCAWQKRPDFTSADLLRDDELDGMDGTNGTNGTNGTEESKSDGKNVTVNESAKSVHRALEDAKIEAPNLLYMIDHVNRLSLWVSTEILSRENTGQMSDMIRYFYFVAQRCLEIGNIHTCTSIFGGITLEPVRRLRRLNRMVQDDQQLAGFHALFSEIISCERNYGKYRSMVDKWFANQKMIHGCIPFMPVTVKDLFQIQLHLTPRNKDGEKVVDLKFLEKNCRHIRRVYETQQRARLYCNQFAINTDVQSLLRMNIARYENEEQLREWSLAIQPKLSKADKENLEMIDTLEEFGFL